jgi:hypothetical protein
MTRDEAKTAFLSMLPKNKMRVLSLLAHKLTICARTAYLPEVSDDLARQRLRGLNELLHDVTSQVMHMVSEDTNRYPDDVFMFSPPEYCRPFGARHRLSLLSRG